MRRWVWDVDMPGALVVDEMDLRDTFTTFAAAMLCKLVTEKVVMGLPLSILRGNTLEEWVILMQDDFPGIDSEEREWYSLQRLNSMPRHLLEIQTTPPHGPPALVSALQPILVVTMRGVAEIVKTVIDEMIHGIDFELVNLLHTKCANLTHGNLNTSIEEPENWWNMPLVWYDILTSRAKPSNNDQLSCCAWRFVIFDESHQYKTKNSVGRQIVMNAKIGFKRQVTAIPGFHSLYNWSYQTMWLLSVASKDPLDDTVMDKQGLDELHSAVKILMHAIWTEHQETQQDGAQRKIQIAEPWTIRRWSESRLADGKPLVWILKENACLIDRVWTEHKQAKLKALVERYTSHGASGAWRVHQLVHACFWLVLGDTDDHNDVSGQWYNEWPLDSWVDSPVFALLRERFLPILVNEHMEYPKPDEDNPLEATLLQKQERPENSLPSAPLPQRALIFCPLPGQVCHLKWWLTKYFADHVDILHMYAEMCNDEQAEMHLKFQDSHNPSVFVTTPNVGRISLNLTAANHAVITQMFWVLNEQWQAFARVVWSEQNTVPQPWSHNMGPGGSDYCVSDLRQRSGVAQMRVLHGLMSRPNFIMSMIYRILEYPEEHTQWLMENGDIYQSVKLSS